MKAVWITLILAVVASPALQATIVFETVGDLGGSGLGNVSTVLTQASPAADSDSSGCVFWDGSATQTGAANCPAGATFGGDEQAINSTFTIGSLGILDFADFRIAYNSTEPQNLDGVTLEELVFFIQAPSGALLYSDILGAPVVHSQTQNGIGNSAFLYMLNDPASANAFLADPANVLGLAAKVSSETGGPETFFFGIVGATLPPGPPAAGEIPEPSTALLMAFGCGLLLLGRLKQR